ncbi:MAG: sigma-70 family RNA polymerase sigma factor [Acidobacteriota bacterium]
MDSTRRDEITELLLDWSAGDGEALDRLMPLVTGELRRLAYRFFEAEREGHTLQPTALVNELYLRLVDRRRVQWQSRAQFFAFAAQTMRRILVDHARAHKAAKRGDGLPKVLLDERLGLGLPAQQSVDIIALDEALDRLAQLDTRQAKVVELRFFAGLTLDETATVLDVGAATVSRDWTTARAWLFRELGSSATGASSR